MACVGIDLGTTYSVVSVYKFPKVSVIYADGADTPLVPSVVSFDGDQQLVGEEAVKGAADNPKNTIYEIKRLMGRKYEDEEVKKIMKNLTYDVVKHDGKLKVKVKRQGKDQYMTPEEISAIILRKLKEIAEAHLKTDVTHAVITVPAYFQDIQRQATVDAGTIAGLAVRRIINEPTAAALAYGLDVKLKKEKQILVYDLGGGTFDVSILKIKDNNITVLSTHGDTFLGGSNFVDEMMNFVTTRIKERFRDEFKKSKLEDDMNAMIRIRERCEAVKRQLSLRQTLNIGDIDDVLLVGGSTHIPTIKLMMKDKFKKEVIAGINRDQIVSCGAGIQASILHGTNVEDIKDLLLQDVTPLTLGISVDDGIMSDVISRCSRIPIKRRKNYTTRNDNQTSMRISVYEGERPIVKENFLLGEFTLQDIPRAPAGTPTIYVTFDIDENSILKVTAKDKSGGKEITRTVSSKKGNLSKEDVEQLLKSANVFRQVDMEKRDKLAARAELHGQVTSMLSKLGAGDFDAKLTFQEKKRMEDKMKEHLLWQENNAEANLNDYKERAHEIRKSKQELERKQKSTRRRVDNVD